MQTIKTGIETIGDMIKGEGLKISLKRRAKQHIQELVAAKTNIKRKTNQEKLL